MSTLQILAGERSFGRSFTLPPSPALGDPNDAVDFASPAPEITIPPPAPAPAPEGGVLLIDIDIDTDGDVGVDFDMAESATGMTVMFLTSCAVVIFATGTEKRNLAVARTRLFVTLCVLVVSVSPPAPAAAAAAAAAAAPAAAVAVASAYAYTVAVAWADNAADDDHEETADSRAEMDCVHGTVRVVMISSAPPPPWLPPTAGDNGEHAGTTVVVIGTVANGISEHPQCKTEMVVVRQVSVRGGREIGCMGQMVVYVVEITVGERVRVCDEEEDEVVEMAIPELESEKGELVVFVIVGAGDAVPEMLTPTLTLALVLPPLDAVMDDIAVVVVVVVITEEAEKETLASPPVLLYIVNRMVSPFASASCLPPSRDGGGRWTRPPHFCAGLPGHVVLHAESGYWIKSSEDELSRGRE
ncbi:uncharacterized protein Z519_01312 [Cladophialophora bantiana CBS 173.52]|uniref:Uncharacterized protein n=1 Tax=Cladophialophora bantiana (strain ATCC 10958 / CBS 173.52 / CDC B-1940 / NIH 8579) TaxID=1442370 RepID=A0A0D2HWI0_CLAB1|nr:uncharacterized protein Z519_01312 [Cladophialophora bantiana CBS 173.52]KIW97728.1 hypothetical protein Z519_01312 [Cladophialophora bantiana CBS 173.52]